MNSKSLPYKKLAPATKALCVGIRTVTKACDYTFGPTEVVVSESQTAIHYAFWDGTRAVKGVSQVEEGEKMEEGKTYLLKDYFSPRANLICLRKDSQVYRSAKLDADEATKTMVRQLLWSATRNVLAKDYVMEVGHVDFITIRGKVESETSVMKRNDAPMKEITVISDGGEAKIVLWRETALLPVHVTDDVIVSHLKVKDNGQYGVKAHSSNYTTITTTKKNDRTVTNVDSVTERDGCLILLNEEGEETSIPRGAWAGDIEAVVEALPLKVMVSFRNDDVIGLPMEE